MFWSTHSGKKKEVFKITLVDQDCGGVDEFKGFPVCIEEDSMVRYYTIEEFAKSVAMQLEVLSEVSPKDHEAIIDLAQQGIIDRELKKIEGGRS